MTTLKKSSYWLSVATLGIILGLSIQFAKAWTEPTAIAPNGNVGAPINTGDNSQYKAGAFGIGKVLHGYSNAVFDGNVGIGTTSPAYKLHIVGEAFIAPSSSGRYHFTSSSTSGYTTTFNMDNTALSIGHNSASRALNLRTGNANRLTIAGNGNVGIGTTSPMTKLDVRGTIRQDTNSNYDIWIQGGASTTSGAARNLALLGVKSSDRLYLNYNNEYTGGVTIGGNARVTGGLRIGDTTTCTNGTIRFNSGAFQGCEDGAWVYLNTCKDTCGKYTTSAWASPYKRGATTICEYSGHYFSCKSSESYTMSRYWNGGNYWDVQCNAGSNCWVRNHPSGSWHNAGIVTHCTRCTGEY